MRDLVRQVTHAKEVELSAARDAIATVKSEHESEHASLQKAVQAEARQFRYLPITPFPYRPPHTVQLSGVMWWCVAMP